MRCKLLQKTFTGKTTECFKDLRHIAIEKNILPELNICIFQIPLKFIKLVIPKILFILALCSFNFYFKITSPPNKITPTPKLKFLTPPSQQRLFRNLYPPSPKMEGAQLKLSPLIQICVQQDYLTESYARYLHSYQKYHKIVALTRCGLSPLSLNLYG